MSEFGDLDEVLDDDGSVSDSSDDQSTDSTDEQPPEVRSEQSTDSEPAVEESGGFESTPARSIKTRASPSPSTVKELLQQETPGKMSGSDRYPFAIRRSSWDDERLGPRKMVLREGTKEMEETAVAEIKEELFPDTDLYVTDIREAAYIVGLRNLDETVEVLNEWGFAEQQDM